VDVDVLMPEMGESIAEATILRWMRHEGDPIERDESIAEIESDKAVVELPSPAKGVVKHIRVAEEETVPVGTVIAVIEAEVDSPAAAPAPAEAPATPPAPSPASPPPIRRAVPTGEGVPFLSPLVARLVAQHGVDPTQVTGTGMGGRITKKDVMAHIGQQGEAPPPAPAVAAPPEPAPAPEPPAAPKPAPAQEGTRVVPLEGIRAAIADHLVQSVRSIPHVTTVAEADMSACAAVRAKHKADFEARGLKLSYMPLILGAIARSVPEFPGVNASLVDRRITYYEKVHLGVSVAREQGLVVVVIRDAQDRSIAQLAEALQDFAQRARDGKLKRSETRGSTLTVTNPGSLGAILSTPIINAPESAIVSVQAIQKRPVVVDDAIAVRPMMYMGMSYDHRVIDGAEAIGFLQAVRRQLESPEFDMR